MTMAAEMKRELAIRQRIFIVLSDVPKKRLADRCLVPRKNGSACHRRQRESTNRPGWHRHWVGPDTERLLFCGSMQRIRACIRDNVGAWHNHPAGSSVHRSSAGCVFQRVGIPLPVVMTLREASVSLPSGLSGIANRPNRADGLNFLRDRPKWKKSSTRLRKNGILAQIG